ncbi:MAG: DNA primase [Paracoccaceae bacterium]|jgi:DNA primase
MSLTPGFLEDLRTRASLADIVGRKVTWDRRKSNAARGDWWAPCPFHEEKSASFHVMDREGYYKCFGCGASGDAITFLRELENMSFIEAVRALAAEVGVEMPDQDPRAAAQEEKRKGLSDVMDLCVKWFRLQLQTIKAEAARDYLKGRGLTGATAKRFEIGYAPDDRSGLQDHLAGKNIPLDDMIACGVLAKSDDDRVYPRFRGRIMFPIRDGRGRCISFGGRAMDPNAKAKYLNGPETTLFDKGRSLYNVAMAREAAGKSGRLIVAEGYMDVIALAEAGFADAVAPLGTAVTESQLQLMWRLTEEPTIALDGDAAGIRAANRMIDLALPHLGPGRTLRFCIMPEGLDPDDLIRQRGAPAMEAALTAALPLIDMMWRRETIGKTFDTPEQRAALDVALGDLARKIPDRRLRGHYIDALMTRRCALFGIEKTASDPGWDAAPQAFAAPPAPDFARDAPWDAGPPPMDDPYADYGAPGPEMDSYSGADFGAPSQPSPRREVFKPWKKDGGKWRKGGFGRDAPPEGPSPETRASVLARTGRARSTVTLSVAAEDAARVRESAILAGAMAHPVAAAALEDTLAGAPFVNVDLARLRDHLLDALADAPEGCGSAAFRKLIDARLGGDAWRAAGAPAAVALTRALRPDGDPEAAALALGEVLDRHSAIVSALDETEDAARSLLEDGAGEDITHRLAAAMRARDGAATVGRKSESSDDDAEASRRLWAFNIAPNSGNKG